MNSKAIATLKQMNSYGLHEHCFRLIYDMNCENTNSV